jgi:hypothetical protein
MLLLLSTRMPIIRDGAAPVGRLPAHGYPVPYRTKLFTMAALLLVAGCAVAPEPPRRTTKWTASIFSRTVVAAGKDLPAVHSPFTKRWATRAPRAVVSSSMYTPAGRPSSESHSPVLCCRVHVRCKAPSVL